MTTGTKDVLRKRARDTVADPTANARERQLALGVLALMGEKVK